jgi:succinoglycan biosynthesis transport protein ExoP
MQRPNPASGDHPASHSASLAPAAPAGQASNQYAPAPLAHGQSLAPPATARSWPTILELFHAVKRRLVLATFLGLLVGMAAAAAIWLAMPNGKHRAQALLQFKPVSRLGVIQSSGNEGEFAAFRNRETKLVKSRTLLESVVAEPNVAKLPDIRTADDPVRFLSDSISISWPADDLMEIAMRGDDAPAIREIVNTLVTLYLKNATAVEMQDREKTRAVLEAQRDDVNKRIEAREGRLKNQAKSGGGANAETNALLLKYETEYRGKLDTEVRDIDAKIKDIELRMELRKGKLKELEGKAIPPDLLEKALERNPDVAERVAARDAAHKKLERDELISVPGSSVLTDDRAKLKQAQAEVDVVADRLKPTVEKGIRAAMEKSLRAEEEQDADEITLRRGRLNNVKQELVEVTKKIDSTNTAGHNIGIDSDDLKPLKEQRSLIDRQLLDQNGLEKTDTRIFPREMAVVILNQNLTAKVFLAAVCFVAGCVAVMLAVAFLEWRSRRVDSVEQVVNDLGLRVIGTIPAFPSKQALKSGDPAQSRNWRFVLNESVNSARTMLLHTAKTENMQILMVTSAMQGEGKTSLASQLATSMATAGLRTLILDCDLRNPSMHKLFDAPLTPGCAEVLCQEIDVSDAVQPTTVPNLWLIPAGQCSNRVITALAQGHPLETLFNRLRGQFDFIVVDSCPVLPVADSLLVGQHVDGVVLSILQDISQLPKVMTTADKLTLLNIPLLGAVVNGIKPDIHAYGYNYVKQLPA